MEMKNKPNSALKFIAEDCFAAVQANPRNAKAIEYIQTARACEKELARRERIRLYRQDLRDFIFDDLQYSKGNFWGRKAIRNRNKTAYSIDRFKSACWMLGSYRRFNLV